MGNLHSGHRERLRKLVVQEPQNLHEHQILEAILFYAISRSDTNEIAHTLIEAADGLKCALHCDLATAENLKRQGKLSGCGKKTIDLLNFFGEVIDRVEEQDLQRYRLFTLYSYEEYFQKFLGSVEIPKIMMSLLDYDKQIVEIVDLYDLDKLSGREIFCKIHSVTENERVQMAVIGEKRPDIFLISKMSETLVAKKIFRVLTEKEIKVIDYYILGSDNVPLSLRKMGVIR